MSKIKAVLKEPNKPCVVTMIDNSYSFFSSYVKGLIDITPFPKNINVDIILNDEFLLLNMDPNILVSEYKSIYCGPLIFTGIDRKNGTQKSLSDKQIKQVMTYCKENDAYNYLNIEIDFNGGNQK